MANMLLDETPLTFAEAAARLPKINGKKVHVSSVWRWSRRGVRGVRLECRCLGGRYLTSIEALDRFATQLADLPPEHRRQKSAAKRRARTAKQRQRDIERAERQLADSGI